MGVDNEKDDQKRRREKKRRRRGGGRGGRGFAVNKVTKYFRLFKQKVQPLLLS